MSSEESPQLPVPTRDGPVSLVSAPEPSHARGLGPRGDDEDPLQRVLWLAMAVLLLIGSLAATIWLLLGIAREVYGSFQMEAPTQDVSDALLAARGGRTVGILRSNLDRLFAPGEVEEVVQTWTGFLEGIDFTTRELTATADGGLSDINDVDIIVVVTPQGVSPGEKARIAAALSQGAGLLFSSSVNMTEDDAIILLDGLWRSLLRAQAVRMHAFQNPHFLPFERGNPFAARLQPGDGVLFTPGMKVAALAEDEVRERGGQYPEPTFSPGAEARDWPPQQEVPIRYGERGEGRWAFLGFDPTGIPVDAADREVATSLLVDAFAWLSRTPLVEVKSWPWSHDSASMLAIDLQGRPEPSDGIVSALTAQTVPATFFYSFGPGSEAPQGDAPHPPGEVATRGNTRDTLENLRPAEQARRLRSARARLAHFGEEAEVVGLMPPGEVYAEPVLTLAQAEGYRYVFAKPRTAPTVPALREFVTEGLLPWRHSVANLVQIPRTVEDDIGLTLALRSADPAQLVEHYVKELSRLRRQGGLFTPLLHADFFERPGAGGAFLRLLGAMTAEEEGHGWLATGSEVAAWWAQREQVAVSLGPGALRRVELRVTNNGTDAVKGLRVRLFLPAPVERVDVSLAHWRGARIAGGGAFRVDYTPGSSELDVVFEELSPTSNDVLHLDYW